MGAGDEALPGMWKNIKKKRRIRSWGKRRNWRRRMVLTCPLAISCPLLHLRLLSNLQSLQHLRHRATSPHCPGWPGDYSGKKRWWFASRANVPALRYPKLFCTFLRVEQNPTNDNSYLECKIFIITQGVSIEPSPIRVLKRNAALIQPELLCHEILSSEGGGAGGASIRQDTTIAQDFLHLLQYRSEVNLPRAVSTPKIDSQVPKRSLL